MSRRGPAPTPAKILKLRGTYRPDRDAPNAPEPPTPAKVPYCPTWIRRDVPWGDYAREAYRRIAPPLLQAGLFTEIDLDAILSYADATARWRYWREELGRLGTWTQETESGYIAQRPEVGFMNRADEDMRRWGSLFGLSPSDRRRVSAIAQQDNSDAAADFLFGGAQGA